MRFLREDKTAAARAIAKSICNHLADNKRVLWLVSGGSNVPIEKAVMDTLLQHASTKLSGLAVLPIDERYGPPGHKDSNVQQLREAGFDPGAATLIDVLMHDAPFDQTVTFYNDVASTAFASAGVVIGQFGMGADGHIAGIKPASPATESDESTVTGYTWEDYQRLTLMPAVLRQITTGFLMAYGDDKREPLNHLQKNDEPFARLPAVLLYEIPDICVYNDYIMTDNESEGMK